MARKKKQEPAVHIVLDTNSLYTGRMDKLLSEEASDFVRTEVASLDVDSHVLVPHVVISERRRQMIAEAQKIYPQVAKLEKLLGQSFVNHDLILSRISAIIDDEIASHNIQVLNVDYTRVDWDKLVDNALFRQAPFSADVSDKGFKDAVILEAICQLSSKLPPEQEKAILCVVCNDERLIEGINARLPDGHAVQICRTFGDLTTVLSAVRSNISQEVADAFVAQADILFAKSGADSLQEKWEVRAFATGRSKSVLAKEYDLVVGGILHAKTALTEKVRTKIRFRTVVALAVTAKHYETKTILPQNQLQSGIAVGQPWADSATLAAQQATNALSASVAGFTPNVTNALYGITAGDRIYQAPPAQQLFLNLHEGTWSIVVDWTATVSASTDLTDIELSQISAGKFDWSKFESRPLT